MDDLKFRVEGEAEEFLTFEQAAERLGLCVNVYLNFHKDGSGSHQVRLFHCNGELIDEKEDTPENRARLILDGFALAGIPAELLGAQVAPAAEQTEPAGDNTEEPTADVVVQIGVADSAELTGTDTAGGLPE